MKRYKYEILSGFTGTTSYQLPVFLEASVDEMGIMVGFDGDMEQIEQFCNFTYMGGTPPTPTPTRTLTPTPTITRTLIPATPTPTPMPGTPGPTPTITRTPGPTPTITPEIIYGLSINPISWELSSLGGNYSPNVTTDSSVVWNVSTSSGWVNLTNNTNRMGSTNFTISASSNVGVGAVARDTADNVTVTPTTTTSPTHVHFSMYQRFFSTTKTAFSTWNWNSNTPKDSVTLDSSNYDNIELTTIPAGFWVYDGADNQLYEGYMINVFAPGGIIKVQPSSANNPSGASGFLVVTDSDGATIEIWCQQNPLVSITPSLVNNSGDPNYSVSLSSGYAEVTLNTLHLTTVSQYVNPAPPPTYANCDLGMTIEIQHNAYAVQYYYPTWHSTSGGSSEDSVITLNNIVYGGDTITVTVTGVSTPF